MKAVNNNIDNRDEPHTQHIETEPVGSWTFIGSDSINVKVTKDVLNDAKLSKLACETIRRSHLSDKLLSEANHDISMPPKKESQKSMGLFVCAVVLMLASLLIPEFIYRPQIMELSSLDERIQYLEIENLALKVEAKRLVELHGAGQGHYQLQEKVVQKPLVEQKNEWTDENEKPTHIPKEPVKENNKNDEQSITKEKSKIKNTENEAADSGTDESMRDEQLKMLLNVFTYILVFMIGVIITSIMLHPNLNDNDNENEDDNDNDNDNEDDAVSGNYKHYNDNNDIDDLVEAIMMKLKKKLMKKKFNR